jgi:hypothetical protein
MGKEKKERGQIKGKGSLKGGKIKAKGGKRKT